MVKNHVDEFSDHIFNLKKYLSDDNFLFVVLKLFWSESFKEFMETPDEAVDNC